MTDGYVAVTTALLSAPADNPIPSLAGIFPIYTQYIRAASIRKANDNRL